MNLCTRTIYCSLRRNPKLVCWFVYKESKSRKYRAFIHKWEIQRRTSASAAFYPLHGLDLVHVLTHFCDFRTPMVMIVIIRVHGVSAVCVCGGGGKGPFAVGGVGFRLGVGGQFFGDPYDFHMEPKEEKGQKIKKLTFISNKCGNFNQKRVIFGYFGLS